VDTLNNIQIFTAKAQKTRKPQVVLAKQFTVSTKQFLYVTSTAVMCPCTGKIANGQHSGSRSHGGVMKITCNAGFKASGTATLNCVNGKWDAAVPQCIGKDVGLLGAHQAERTTPKLRLSLKICFLPLGYFLCLQKVSENEPKASGGFRRGTEVHLS